MAIKMENFGDMLEMQQEVIKEFKHRVANMKLIAEFKGEVDEKWLKK